MEAAIVVDGTGLLQNQRHRFVRRHCHVEVAVSRGGSMGEHVLVDQLDGVADLCRSLRWRDHEILHRDLNGRRICRDGRS